MSIKTDNIIVKTEEEDLEKKKRERLIRLQRIEENYSKYKNTVIFITIGFIVAYLIWIILSFFLVKILEKIDYSHTEVNLTTISVNIVFAFVLGIIYSVDGFISGLIKTPSNQLFYEINHAASSSFVTKEQKEELMTEITVANEYSRETFKRFGMLTLVFEALAIIVSKKSSYHQMVEKNGFCGYILFFAYLIPMCLCFRNMREVSLLLKKMKEDK